MTDTVVRIEPSFDDFSVSGKVRPVKHLVLILHGIYSISDRWYELRDFEGRYEDLSISVKPVSYALIGVFSLFLGLGKRKRLRLVEERLIQAIEDNGDFDQVSIHCHSNGTKIFADLPSEVKGKFDWIFFAGSICHVDDDRKFACCHDNLINDCGTRDYYPIVAAAVRKGTFGHTGVVGFHNPPIRDRFFRYGHSDATAPEHFAEWLVPVLRTGTPPIPPHRCERWKLYAPDILRGVFGLSAMAFVAGLWMLYN